MLVAFIFIDVVLISYGLGAPVSQLKELDKRRESTPEILDLEDQLKKASGEDKKQFSFNAERPMPQVDGLANYGKSEKNKLEHQLKQSPEQIDNNLDTVNLHTETDHGSPDSIMDRFQNGDPDGYRHYTQVWNFLRQNPQYVEDYLSSLDDDEQRVGDERNPKRGDSGVIPYPYYGSVDDPDYLSQMYDPADDEDRKEALLAEYFDQRPQQQFEQYDELPEANIKDSETDNESDDVSESNGDDETGDDNISEADKSDEEDAEDSDETGDDNITDAAKSDEEDAEDSDETELSNQAADKLKGADVDDGDVKTQKTEDDLNALDKQGVST